MIPSHVRPVPTTGMRGGLGRTLLTAFLIMVIVPLSLIGYVAFSQVRSDRQHSTIDRLTAAANLQETLLREWINTHASSLTILSNGLTLTGGLDVSQSALEKTSQQLKAVLENDLTFQNIFLVIENNQQPGSAGPSLVQGAWEEEWISVMTGAIGPRPAWAVSPRDMSAPCFRPAPAGAPSFEFASPVPGSPEASQPAGFVVGQAWFTPTAAMSPTSGLGHSEIVYLVNRERQAFVLQSTLPASAPIPGRVSSEHLSQGVARALSGQNGASAYENWAGIPVIGAYRWLDDLQLALIAEQDQAEAFADSDKLAAGLIGATLGVALLTAVIAAVVTRQITRPIVLLTKAAVQMSEGDLAVRVQSTRRDEIGILANVFNTMAAELHELYARLEHKVAERTRELQEAKEQIQYHAGQLAISAEVGRVTTSILDLDMLLEQATQLVRDAFQLERVTVYLLDRPGQVAILRKSVGRAVPAHERRLNLGDAHPVSQTILQRMQHSITLPCNDGASEECSRLVLPLALSTKTIGALDLTTREPAGFSESDRNVLQMLADQLTVAIENARTYSQEHEAADEMREIERLRGQFLMRMSHQLATYLNTIIGFSQLILKGLDGPLTETQAKDLDAIRRSGQQLSQLLDDTLELASLEVGAIELHYAPVNLTDLIVELQTMLASTMVNPQLRLDVQVGPNLSIMMADADRLRQVLSNLVVTAAEISREGVIALRVAQTDDQIQFAISAPTVWDDAEGNHGISLALSRRLVELHGGRLCMGHQAEGSTVFEFTLPINIRWMPESNGTGSR